MKYYLINQFYTLYCNFHIQIWGTCASEFCTNKQWEEESGAVPFSKGTQSLEKKTTNWYCHEDDSLHATEDTRSPLQLFQLCFSRATMTNLCRNTNKYVAGKKATGRKARWFELEVQELYKFLKLLIRYTTRWCHRNLLSTTGSRINLFRFQLHWWQEIDSECFFFWNRRPSDQEEDKNNDAKRGTTQQAAQAKEILNNSKAHYNPKKNLAVDQRKVATKAKTGMSQYMKDKPTKWGINLFVPQTLVKVHNQFDVVTGKKTLLWHHHNLNSTCLPRNRLPFTFG